MGNKKDEEAEEVLIIKWAYLFNLVMDAINAKKISPSGAIVFAISTPASKMLCENSDEAIEYANKAVEMIKADKDVLLYYDSKEDMICKRDF